MINKRATAKAIKWAEKKSKTKLAKNSNWEAVFEAVMDPYYLEMLTQCPKTGGKTIIKIFQEKQSKLKTTLELDSNESYDKTKGDWDWMLIYKSVVEHLMTQKKRK